MRPSTTLAVGGLWVLATTLVNGPGHPGVFFSNKVQLLINLFTMSASTGLLPSTITRDHSTDGHPAYNIATTSTHSMEVFSLILKQVHHNFVYIQLLLQANP
jgi:hypothetical protein